jgi:two-component system, cell cycle response regulator DivK
MGRVAIVEDDEDTREVFKLTLQDGHEFLTFASGQEFLKVFRPCSFDLILLDLAMPEMDGFEVFERIQAIDKDVPVVAITAMVFPGDREKALQAGFCDYFVKPIMDIERFQQMVYSHIGECSNPPYGPLKNKPAA